MLSIKDRFLRAGATGVLLGGLIASNTALAAEAAIPQQRLDAFAQAMQAQVEQGKIGGIATLVYQNGEIVQR